MDVGLVVDVGAEDEPGLVGAVVWPVVVVAAGVSWAEVAGFVVKPDEVGFAEV